MQRTLLKSKIHRACVTDANLHYEGSLTIDVDRISATLPMDDSSCEAADVHVQEIVGKVSGPKLKNDAPSGAIALAIPATVDVKTGGTALEPEQPCLVDFDGNEEELPFGHTAWWTFTGTGGDVTVDTAGSNFDTAVGVYVPNGGWFDHVGEIG